MSSSRPDGTTCVSFRASYAELEALHLAADALGMSMSAFLRSIVFDTAGFSGLAPGLRTRKPKHPYQGRKVNVQNAQPQGPTDSKRSTADPIVKPKN